MQILNRYPSLTFTTVREHSLPNCSASERIPLLNCKTIFRNHSNDPVKRVIKDYKYLRHLGEIFGVWRGEAKLGRTGSWQQWHRDSWGSVAIGLADVSVIWNKLSFSDQSMFFFIYATKVDVVLLNVLTEGKQTV